MVKSDYFSQGRLLLYIYNFGGGFLITSRA